VHFLEVVAQLDGFGNLQPGDAIAELLGSTTPLTVRHGSILSD